MSLWVMIQVCSNEGPNLFLRGDNDKTAKNFKIFSSRTAGPISTKFDAKHRWVKGIQVCSNEEPFTSLKVNKGFFSSLNQHYDNHVY